MVEPREHDGRSLACWRYAKLWWEHGRRLGHFLGSSHELRDVMAWVHESRTGSLTGGQVAFLVGEERAAAMRHGESVEDYRIRAVGARGVGNTHLPHSNVVFAVPQATAAAACIEVGGAIPAERAQPILTTRSGVTAAQANAPNVSPPRVGIVAGVDGPVIQTAPTAVTVAPRGNIRVPPTPTAILPPPPAVAHSQPMAHPGVAPHLSTPTSPAVTQAKSPPRMTAPTVPVTAPSTVRLAAPTVERTQEVGVLTTPPCIAHAHIDPLDVTCPLPQASAADDPEIRVAPSVARSKWARPVTPPVLAAEIPSVTEEAWEAATPLPILLAAETIQVWTPPAPAARSTHSAQVDVREPVPLSETPPVLGTPGIVASRASAASTDQGEPERTHVVPHEIEVATIGAAAQPIPTVVVARRVKHITAPVAPTVASDGVGVVAAPVPVLDALDAVLATEHAPAGVLQASVAVEARTDNPVLDTAGLVAGVQTVGPVVSTFTAPPARITNSGWRPIQRRARRLVARWALSHRDARTGRVKWSRFATEIVSSLALVAAGYWGARTLNPAQAHPEVAVTEAPAAASITEAFSPVPDWADSIPNPDEVWGLQRGGRSYAPVGGGRPAPRTREPSWTTEGESPRAVPPVLVRRVSGSSLMLYALTGDSLPLRGARWALPGLCQQVLTVQGAADAWSASARDDGGQAGWLYGLAVPASQCAPASGQVIARVQPTTFEREALLRGLVSARGDLIGAELQDVAFGRIDGTRHAWGVFRVGGEKITMIPAPPAHYVGFVATESGRTWNFKWLRSLEGERVQMALAGVFDTDNDGFPEAVFGQRDVGGTAEVAVVSFAQNNWAIRLTRALEAAP